MKRRDLLIGMALAASFEAEAEAEQPTPESLYIPKPHLVQDRQFLYDFMDEYSFVDLITTSPTLRITHIPALLDRTSGTYGTIFGHISRNNVQRQAFDGKQTAVVVFRGAHAYISPTWYSKPEAVPTWNFAVVHASGKLQPIEDKKALHDLLGRLIHKFENRYGESKYDFSKLPDSYINGMLGGIVGFQMEVELLEGKFKLGQERNEADRASMVSNLKTAKEGPSIAELTQSLYDHQRKV
jgi:transcriptional regulator